LNAVGDEFQHPDDTKKWWSSMPDPKHFVMTPNAEHSMATGIPEIVPAIGSHPNFFFVFFLLHVCVSFLLFLHLLT